MKRLLIVDDDARMRRVLQIVATKLGLECAAKASADEALDAFRAERADLVITDLKMPGKSGIEFLRELRVVDPEVPVIVLTAHGTVVTAVEAMKLGAVDYLLKPFDLDGLELVIRRALDVSRVRLENRFLREQAGGGPRLGELVGGSAAMQPVFELIREVAPTKSAVLVTGETGTGKELVALAIHESSPRKDKLFVPLNCAAIPSDLLESELFGHVRGAFSGAQADRVGKFQAADEGTLFLDEIGEMDARLQAKLLRVVQEGVIEPLGTNRRVPVDVRIISSTNRNLESAMHDGSFREDLYYRLNVLRIAIPPLRERPEDVARLAQHFLRRCAARME
ncbi:MAG: sigma-54-dependent transcriptional regulator, partial [Candidatus Binatia bacterium]